MDFTTMTDDELYNLSAMTYEKLRHTQHDYEAITEEVHRRDEEHKAKLWEEVKNALEKYVRAYPVDVRGQAYNDPIGRLNSHSFDTVGVISISKS